MAPDALTDSLSDLDAELTELDALEFDYDPLADATTDTEDEDDPGDFTGTPLTSLSGAGSVGTPGATTPASSAGAPGSGGASCAPVPAGAPSPDAGAPGEQPSPAPAAQEPPASERIEALFERFNPRRRVLAGILRFLDTPQSAADLDAKVEELQQHDFSVYTGANYTALLEEAGAIEKTNEDGVPFSEVPEQEPQVVTVDGAEFLKPAPWREVFWLATDDARAYLAQDDPLARFEELISSDAQYLSIYLRILEAADQKGGVSTPELNELVDSDPLLESPRLYTAHFTERLERCEALRWDGAWEITEVGRALLDGTIDCSGTICESEA